MTVSNADDEGSWQNDGEFDDEYVGTSLSHESDTERCKTPDLSPFSLVCTPLTEALNSEGALNKELSKELNDSPSHPPLNCPLSALSAVSVHPLLWNTLSDRRDPGWGTLAEDPGRPVIPLPFGAMSIESTILTPSTGIVGEFAQMRSKVHSELLSYTARHDTVERQDGIYTDKTQVARNILRILAASCKKTVRSNKAEEVMACWSVLTNQLLDGLTTLPGFSAEPLPFEPISRIIGINETMNDLLTSLGTLHDQCRVLPTSLYLEMAKASFRLLSMLLNYSVDWGKPTVKITKTVTSTEGLKHLVRRRAAGLICMLDCLDAISKPAMEFILVKFFGDGVGLEHFLVTRYPNVLLRVEPTCAILKTKYAELPAEIIQGSFIKQNQKLLDAYLENSNVSWIGVYMDYEREVERVERQFSISTDICQMIQEAIKVDALMRCHQGDNPRPIMLNGTARVFGSALTGLTDSGSDIDINVCVLDNQLQNLYSKDRRSRRKLARLEEQYDVFYKVVRTAVNKATRNDGSRKRGKFEDVEEQEKGHLLDYISAEQGLSALLSETLGVSWDKSATEHLRALTNEIYGHLCIQDYMPIVKSRQFRALINMIEYWSQRTESEGQISIQVLEARRNARIPVLKLEFIKDSHRTMVDLTMTSDLSYHNSILLKQYADTNPIARSLMRLVKRWAEARGVKDAASGFLSSYSWVVLVIFFLQQSLDWDKERVVAPILRPIEGLEKKKELGIKLGKDTIKVLVFQEKRSGAAKELKKHYDAQQSNGEFNLSQPGVAQVSSMFWYLRAFFFFYSSVFDWQNHVVSIRTGKIVRKEEWRITGREPNQWRWSIEDPYESLVSPMPRDLGCVLRVQTLQHIVEELRRGYSIMTQFPYEQSTRELFSQKKNSAINDVVDNRRQCLDFEQDVVYSSLEPKSMNNRLHYNSSGLQIVRSQGDCDATAEELIQAGLLLKPRMSPMHQGPLFYMPGQSSSAISRSAIPLMPAVDPSGCQPGPIPMNCMIPNPKILPAPSTSSGGQHDPTSVNNHREIIDHAIGNARPKRSTRKQSATRRGGGGNTSGQHGGAEESRVDEGKTKALKNVLKKLG